MFKKSLSGLLNAFLLFFIPGLLYGQETAFEQIYGTYLNQSGKDVLPTTDGGYMIAATTENSTINDLDVLIMKTDKSGNTLWTKTYGGSKPEYPNGMLQTPDGNFFIVGSSQSFGGGDNDIYLLKINAAGDTLWGKDYGSFGNEDGKEIVATADGNYVIAGGASGEAFLMKINPDGKMLWIHYYGGSDYESARSVKLCLDGGFILAGKTALTDNDVAKIYLVKTNTSGDTLWTRSIGGSHSYEGKFILANSDGSYTLGIDDSSGSRDSDVGVMKLNSIGKTLWVNTYGGTEKDICKMIQPTSEGGYILAGVSRSFGWIYPDMWLIKITSTGDTSWTRHYGSPWYHDHAYAVRQTADGGYIAIGHSENGQSVIQILLVKLNPLLVAIDEAAFANTLIAYPNPTNGMVTIELEMSGASGSTLSIRNALGQEVFSENIHAYNQNERRSVDLSGKEPGLYFLTLQSAKQLTTQRLILE